MACFSFCQLAFMPSSFSRVVAISPRSFLSRSRDASSSSFMRLHAQAACRLVHEVDGLVGQEAVRDVAVGKICCRDERGVRDAHAVVLLVLVLDAAEN